MTIFFLNVAFSPVAHASILGDCARWLRGPQHTVTNDFDDSLRVDVDHLTPEELKRLLGKPVSYKTSSGVVGPVVFHRASAFSWGRRKIIDRIMTATQRPDWIYTARARERAARPEGYLYKRDINTVYMEAPLEDDFTYGIEAGQAMITLSNGRTLITPLNTSYSPHFIDLYDILPKFENFPNGLVRRIVKIEIFHSHPGILLMEAKISHGDVTEARKLAQRLAELALYPQIHIYAINDSPWGRLIAHFSTQR